MSKKLIGLTLALALFAVALPASAAGLTQTQISDILSLLQSFGAEQSVINNVSVSLGGGTPGNSGSGVSCIELSYNLFSGSTDNTTGGQVTKLQRFLGVDTTGYFGPATEAAVQRWQAQNGVVSSGSPDSTGYGYVGTKTRAAMARGCSGTQQNITLTANPLSGAVPLTVMFTVGNLPDNATRYAIDYGDENGATDPVRSEGDSRKDSISHTFTRPGTYTVKVGTFGGESGLLLAASVVAQIQVTVTGQTANTPSATVDAPVVTPIAGSNRFDVAFKGSAVNFGGTHTGDQRYNWAWVSVVPSSYDGSLDLHAFKGKGESGPVVGSSGAEVHNNKWAHSFNLAAGTYKVLVYDYYGVSSMPVTTRTITISNNKTATLDQNSLIVHTEKDYTRVTVTGSASNVERVDIGVKGYSDSSARVVNGRWSATLGESLPTGTYALQVTDAFSNVVLTTGTLVVKTNMQTRDVRIDSFTASSLSVRAGEAVTFAWSSNLTQNDVSQYGGGCSIEGITSNNVALNVTPGFTSASGQLTYLPPSTATYTLRCSSSAKDGSSIDTERVTVSVN